MKLRVAFVCSFILMSVPTLSRADIEDGGFYDAGSGEMFGGGDGGDFGYGDVTTSMTTFDLDVFTASELAIMVTGSSQRVEIVGARILDSNYYSSVDMSEYDRAALYEANQLINQQANAVQVSPTNSANNPKAKAAAASLKNASNKAKQDRSRLDSIDKSVNRCSPSNQAAVRAISTYNAAAMPTYHFSCNDYQYADYCTAVWNTYELAAQYGNHDSTVVNLQTGVDALRAEMTSISSWATGILESCDL